MLCSVFWQKDVLNRFRLLQMLLPSGSYVLTYSHSIDGDGHFWKQAMLHCKLNNHEVLNSIKGDAKMDAIIYYITNHHFET